MTTGRFLGILACVIFLLAWCPMVWNAVAAGQFRHASDFGAIVMFIVYVGPIIAVGYIIKRLIKS